MKIMVFNKHRPYKLTEPLKAVGAEFYPFVQENYCSNNYQFMAEGLKAIKKFKPDVLFVHGNGQFLLLVSALSFITDVPLVIRYGGDQQRRENEKINKSKSQNLYYRAFKNRMKQTINECVSKLARGFIVVSEHLKEEITESYPWINNIEVVSQHIETDKLAGNPENAREKVGLTSRQQIILSVTNLKFEGKYKALKKYTPAIVRILRENEELSFLVAGGGEYLETYRNYISSLDSKIESRIYTPGYLENIGDYYQLADYFFYFSFEDGLPNVVLEAQGAGIPVICNNYPAMKETVSDGKTGYLVENGEQLYEKFSQLQDNPELQEKFNKKASSKIEQEYNPEKVGTDLIAALDNLVS